MGLVFALICRVALSNACFLSNLILKSLRFSLSLYRCSLLCRLGCLPVRIIALSVINVGIYDLCGSHGSGLNYSLRRYRLVSAIERNKSRRNSRLVLLACNILIICGRRLLILRRRLCSLCLSLRVINNRSGRLGRNVGLHVAVYNSNCGSCLIISVLSRLFSSLVILSLLLLSSRYRKERLALSLLLSLGILLVNLLLRCGLIGLGGEFTLSLRSLYHRRGSGHLGSEVRLYVTVYNGNRRSGLLSSILSYLFSNLILLSLLLFSSHYCKKRLALSLLLSLSVLLVSLLLRSGIIRTGRNKRYRLRRISGCGLCSYRILVSLSVGINDLSLRLFSLIYKLYLLRTAYYRVGLKLGSFLCLSRASIVCNGGYFIFSYLARRCGKNYGSLVFIIVRANLVRSILSLDHDCRHSALSITLCLFELLDSLLFSSISLEKSCRLLNAGIYPFATCHGSAFGYALLTGFVIGLITGLFLNGIGIFNLNLGSSSISACLNSSIRLKKSRRLLNAGIHPLTVSGGHRRYRLVSGLILCCIGIYDIRIGISRACLLSLIRRKKSCRLCNTGICLLLLGSALCLGRRRRLGGIDICIICAVFCKRDGSRLICFLIYLLVLCHNCIFLLVSRNIARQRRTYKIRVVFTAGRNVRWHSSSHGGTLVKLILVIILGSRTGCVFLLRATRHCRYGITGICSSHHRSGHKGDGNGIRGVLYVIILNFILVLILIVFCLIGKYRELCSASIQSLRIQSTLISLRAICAFLLVLKDGKLSFEIILGRSILALGFKFNRSRFLFLSGKDRLFSYGSLIHLRGRGAYLSHIFVFNLICHH